MDAARASLAASHPSKSQASLDVTQALRESGEQLHLESERARQAAQVSTSGAGSEAVQPLLMDRSEALR